MKNKMFNYFSDFDPSNFYNVNNNANFYTDYFKSNQELFFSFYEKMYKNASEVNKKNKAAYTELSKALNEISKENPSNTEEILKKYKIMVDTLIEQNEDFMNAATKSRDDAYQIIKERTSDMFSNLTEMFSKKEATKA